MHNHITLWYTENLVNQLNFNKNKLLKIKKKRMRENPIISADISPFDAFKY